MRETGKRERERKKERDRERERETMDHLFILIMITVGEAAKLLTMKIFFLSFGGWAVEILP